MSWGGLIMRFGAAKTIADFPPDFKPPPVATAAQLRGLLRQLFPDANHFVERSQCTGDDFWLELNHGCHTDLDGNVSAISVRSNAGSGAIPHLKRLCAALEVRLLDLQTSEFADFSQET